MNAVIAAQLTILGRTEKENGNGFKSSAYFKAAKAISALTTQVVSGKEAQKLPGIGASIAKKVQEILDTRQLQRNVDDSKDEKRAAISFLTSVHGIGPVRAAELYGELKITCMKELASHQDVLNNQQIIGIKHYKDFKMKIPRAEMDLLVNILETHRDKVDKDLIITPCGSYRREKPESGDIDVLITTSNWKTGEDRPASMDEYIKRLVKYNFLSDELAYGERKYMGVCCLKPSETPHRRIDIRFIPFDSYFCGILYFTGSDVFNIRFRQNALDLGYTLNEYALTSLATGEQEDITCEEDVFDALSMRYVLPKNR